MGLEAIALVLGALLAMGLARALSQSILSLVEQGALNTPDGNRFPRPGVNRCALAAASGASRSTMRAGFGVLLVCSIVPALVFK